MLVFSSLTKQNSKKKTVQLQPKHHYRTDSLTVPIFLISSIALGQNWFRAATLQVWLFSSTDIVIAFVSSSVGLSSSSSSVDLRLINVYCYNTHNIQQSTIKYSRIYQKDGHGQVILTIQNQSKRNNLPLKLAHPTKIGVSLVFNRTKADVQ